MKFTDFGFDERLVEGIDATGYDTATPIQEQVIPLILQGKDVIAAAQTGTGKTAAFLLPLIHKIITSGESDHINALIIVPTRELAIQIAENLEGLSYFTPISSLAVYGGGDGASFVQEKQALSRGADIVICTPGRMIGHLNNGYVRFEKLEYLVLDEADRMLDMGFNDDIMKIMSFLPKKRQNLLFSATMPSKIRDLAKKILHQPIEINIALSKPPEKVKQEVFFVYDTQKLPLIKHLLKMQDYKSVLIFCSKKHTVKELNRDLKRAGFSIDEIHSDLEQDVRERVLSSFTNGRLKMLIATDILSRGIHIDNIELVINYDVPNDAEDYVHRIGRTARAEAEGKAYTIINDREQKKFSSIEALIGVSIPLGKVPEHFGPVPGYNPAANNGGGKKRNNHQPFRRNSNVSK